VVKALTEKKRPLPKPKGSLSNLGNLAAGWEPVQWTKTE